MWWAKHMAWILSLNSYKITQRANDVTFSTFCRQGNWRIDKISSLLAQRSQNQPRNQHPTQLEHILLTIDRGNHIYRSLWRWEIHTWVRWHFRLAVGWWLLFLAISVCFYPAPNSVRVLWDTDPFCLPHEGNYSLFIHYRGKWGKIHTNSAFALGQHSTDF